MPNARTCKDSPGHQESTLVVRSRKSKGKSRGGCVGCKERRVKCDEQRPACSRCLLQNRACIYVAIKLPKWKEKTNVFSAATSSKVSKPAPKPTAVRTEVPFQNFNFSNKNLKFSGPIYVPAESIGYQLWTMPKDDLETFDVRDNKLLAHFELVISSDLLIPQICWTRDIMKLAFNNNFLMHAMLTVASRHLRKSSVSKSSQYIDYKILEAHHLHHAISSFRPALLETNVVVNQDALMGGALLLSLYYCSILDFNPYNYAMPEEGACKHLKALIPLASADRHHARKGPFRHICTPPLFHRNLTPTNGPCATLMALINSLDPTTPHLDIYIERIESLTTLIAVSTSREDFTAEEAEYNLGWILRYGGFIPSSFLNLANMLDPIAMIIHMHWFAIALFNIRFVGNRWWYWQEKPAYMIRTVSDYLGFEWSAWLEWPNMILEKCGWARTHYFEPSYVFPRSTVSGIYDEL